ncbi:MAG: plastocyanin/azurin family copper-binding protein [Thermoplasmata archaeon]|nr:plastocyanin/azurin family copper-binding protein [Thermoplasmata archaeon]
MAAIPLWAGSSPQVLGQTNVTITMRDSLAFEPGTFTVEPGATVSLTIMNAGALEHTFTLFGQVDANVPVGNFNDLLAYYNANSELVDMNLNGGTQDTASFTAPSAEGVYTFVCMIAGHAAGGMHGTMTVSSTPDEGPAPIDPLIIGVVVAVVVIVIAVSAVFLLRRRS